MNRCQRAFLLCDLGRPAKDDDMKIYLRTYWGGSGQTGMFIWPNRRCVCGVGRGTHKCRPSSPAVGVTVGQWYQNFVYLYRGYPEVPHPGVGVDNMLDSIL